MGRLQRLITAVAVVFAATAVLHAQQWALPRVSVAILRDQPRHSAEQISQVVMGTPLKVISLQGDWWKVETPEGYQGFIRKNTLSGLSDAEMARWKKSSRSVVIADRTVYVYADPSLTAESPRITDIVSGSIVQNIASDANTIAGGVATPVRLPDGRTGYLESSAISPIEQWASQPWDASFMPEFARRLMGTPYVWGGTSTKGMDCSGLTQICAYRQGVLLPRDASQQVKVGENIDKTDPSLFQPGDLLFFGNTKTGKVTHVAISLGGPDYIHSSALVRISSLDKDSPIYENPGLIAVKRLTPEVARTLSIRANPFFF